MKNEVYHLIQEYTEDFSLKANSQWIAEQLNLSRSVVSKYLNQMVTDQILIKITSRPVLFYDRKQIEEKYAIHTIKEEYKSLEELKADLQEEDPQDFDKLIGNEESLASVVRQCKATIAYPPNGLPILLHGPTGTGKSFIAQLMYEYALNRHLIEKDKQFLAVNCSEYTNNPELLTANLFGSKKGAYTGADKDQPGLIKLAEGGVLFLDEIHCLKPECQEKLFLYMDKGTYHMVGDNETWYTSNVRLIFATTEKPEECLLKTFLRRIPMVITLPSLEERSMRERVQLVHTLFKQEGKRIKKHIMISNAVYNMILSKNFTGNIGDLKNCIQGSCVNAFYRVQEEDASLEIHTYDIPDKFIDVKVLEQGNAVGDVAHHVMIPVEDLTNYAGAKNEMLKLYEEVLSVYRRVEEHKVRDEDFLKHSIQYIDRYYDSIVFKNYQSQDTKTEYIQRIIQNVFELISTKYGIRVSNNDMVAIRSYIQDLASHTYEVCGFENQNDKAITDLNTYITKRYYREYMIAAELAEIVKANMNIEIGRIGTIMMALNLNMMNKQQDSNQRIGIVLAHGYSTASSIADSVNKLLDQYIFDAIDMPLHVDTATIVKKLNDFLSRVGNYEELILLVDMGSLEEIYKGLKLDISANIAIVNNITTKLALEIGTGIKNELSLEQIFEFAKQGWNFNYQIIYNRKKEKVIVCSCASGMGTAEKLKRVILDSLPKNLPIKVMTYDYNTLLKNRLNDAFFNDYHVICIVGTLNPNIEDIRFIPIEDFIINDSLDELDYYFNDYLNEKELQNFKSNILRNFSLSNIMNNLTILNPTKLLEHVADSIDRLQSMLKMTFSNKACFGLYVHICCLIERLVTQRAIDTYENLETFEAEHQEFINAVKLCFKDVESYYNIEISIAEIGYIYEYIHSY